MVKNMRVLVVDDDQVDRAQVSRCLRDQCALIEASTAKEGLKLVRELRPACVLLDYRLPDATGLDVLKELVIERVPVILLTGRGNEKVAVEAMKAGAEDYLIKSEFDQHSLTMAVKNAIDKSDLRRLADDRLNDYEELVAVASQRFRAPVFEIGQLAVSIDEMFREQRHGEATAIIERLRKSAKDLIDFTVRLHQYGTAAGTLRIDRVDLNTVVKEVCEDLSQKYPARVEFSIKPLPAIDGDKEKLRLLMRNLLENAILRAGNQESVKSKISSELDVDHWIIKLSDNANPLRVITGLDPFNPLQSSTQVDGFGLALPMCAKIVRQHGGRIWIEQTKSNKQQGAAETDIMFTLPAIADQRRNRSMI